MRNPTAELSPIFSTWRFVISTYEENILKYKPKDSYQ